MIDLCLFGPRLIPGGILMMDDFGNPGWPGVVDAWKAFVSDPHACDEYGEVRARLEPFAIVRAGIFVYFVHLGVITNLQPATES